MTKRLMHWVTHLLVAGLALLASIGASAQTPQLQFKPIVHVDSDALGNPVLATDQNGQVLWRERYFPYGEPRIGGASKSNRLSFHGKPLDADTGLQYFGARYHDPQIGRFMGIDRAGFDPTNPYSFNCYAFAHNNPYKYTDPDGHAAFLIFAIPVIKTMMAGAAIGAGSSAAIDAAVQYGTTGVIDGSRVGEAALIGGGVGAVTGGAVGISRAVSLVREAGDLARRADEIHGVLDPIAQTRRTTAVLSTDRGRLAAGGARDLTPAQQNAVRAARETPVKLKGEHAEISAIKNAQLRGAKPRALGTSRDICDNCKPSIHSSGGRLIGPRTVVFPE